MATSPLLSAPVLLALALAPAPVYYGTPCAISGSPSAREDVARARHACEAARRRFADLFGETAPSAIIVLHEQAGYEVGLAGDVGVVFWPNGAALGEHSSDAAAARAATHWREVLPHEVMHALTMARFFAGSRVNGHGGYGTPLPDWFEEAIGIWGEPHESRQARVAHARLLPDSMRDLLSILRSPHPAGADARLMAPVPGARAPAHEALRAFYPQAIAVMTFVHDAGGSAAIRELAARFMRDPADSAALAGLPGLPEDMAGIVAAWNAWIGIDDR